MRATWSGTTSCPEAVSSGAAVPNVVGILETGDRPAWHSTAGDGNTLNRPMTRSQTAAGLSVSRPFTSNRGALSRLNAGVRLES